VAEEAFCRQCLHRMQRPPAPKSIDWSLKFLKKQRDIEKTKDQQTKREGTDEKGRGLNRIAALLHF